MLISAKPSASWLDHVQCDSFCDFAVQEAREATVDFETDSPYWPVRSEQVRYAPIWCNAILSDVPELIVPELKKKTVWHF